ncbi:hypothetical protein ACHWQZ_G011436 [Mnemiopsis leidyi]
MKVKKERKHLRYTPPPQFSQVQKSAALEGKEMWLIQIPPGIKAESLNGTKFKLKNNKVISLNENTEMLIQKKCSGHVVSLDSSVPFQGQITLRHKIEIPILEKPVAMPVAEKLPSDLKYRASRGSK